MLKSQAKNQNKKKGKERGIKSLPSSQTVQRKTLSSTSAPRSNDALLPKLVLVCMGSQVILTFLLLILAFSLAKLSGRRPILAERASGEMMQMEYKDPNYRSPAAIKKFTENMVTGLYNWTVVTSDFKKDEGIKRGKVTVPSGVAAAEYGLDITDGFRSGMMTEILDEFTDYEKQVFSSQFSQIVDIGTITEPVPVEGGGWKVDVIANFVVTHRSLTEYFPFNRTFYIRPDYVDKLPSPTNHFENVRNEIRESGMTIYAMPELENPDIAPPKQ